MAQPTTRKRRIQSLSLGNAAALLMVSALLGQLLGFLRTRLVNANFPQTGPGSTDSYFAAFNIPDFFYFTLAAGALGVAFMPFLAEHLHRGDRKGMWKLSTSLLNLLALIMAGVGVIIFVFAEQLIHYIVAPDLTPAQLDKAATIMRFVAFNPLLFTIAGILASAQQALGRFFFYAMAPLFYNLSIIISIFIFGDTLGIVGLGIGACVGAVLQVIVVAFGLIGTKFTWRPEIVWRSADFRQILRQLPPRSLDQGIDQIKSIAETNFARRLGEGFVTYYNTAYIMSTAPVLLIGTAISTAAFPQLTNRLAQGRPDLFRKDFLTVLRAMIWIAMPVVVVCFFTRGYLARLMFGDDAPEIALIFGFLTLAIFFGIMYAIISRWFYARKDSKTPLFVSIFTIGLNIYLLYVLARPQSYGVAGLALAQSFTAMIEVVILTIIMLIRDPKLFDRAFLGGLIRIVSVTGFSVTAGAIMVSFFPLEVGDTGFMTLGSKFALIAGVTLAVHLVLSSLFGLEEARAVFKRVRSFIFKPVPIE